ncbi:DUF305 domain-containing protein [Streptomyces sp. R302]|uniref:DUF305 domain-containing protein n=1 Tax=unclassified Streptomyces TaxID=2593676 RepID=UPI00145C6D54|nr:MULTISPECIES: DUF305 domain-containing protein [unclassified Streptomyces]NML50730.1 DUF305 domain-containing protein [Streptomyces sp. R301]NML80825.1 DUF305 domain-containing protein [Streptomyces sp. R302]
MRTFRKRTTRTRTRALGLTGAVAAAALLLAACGNDGTTNGMAHGGTPSTTATATAPSAAAGTFNDADVMFAQMMIPHHEQALDMAELADGRAEDADVKKIVAAIEKAQDPEIQKMRAWLKGWGKPESAGMDHGMAGMMSEQDMKDLAAAKGKDFDRTFAELMIAHHEGAVEMAKTEQKDGGNAEAKALAGEVVTAQTAEIAELRKILDRL